MKIVLASDNPGKLAELRALLSQFGIDVISQSEAGVDAIPETGLTFVENAVLKARHAAQKTGLAALADDSGLCVEALGGAPGLYSARYAGDACDDAANNAKLLEALGNRSASERQACFYCVLVFLRHATDPRPIIAEGRWTGSILSAPRGERGFGYDPIFLDPRSGLSAAEMPPEMKNQRSHRGRALAALHAHLLQEH